MALRFTWDVYKARDNLRKHGVGFVEATTAFNDLLSVCTPDVAHSQTEERFVLIGQTRRGRLIVVAHSDDGHQIRIINARAATRREQHTDEEDQR